MRCYECGGTYEEKRGFLELTDRYIGNYFIDELSYRQCDECKGLLFSSKAARLLEKRRNKVRAELVNSHPIAAFINANETASLLSIRRALLKYQVASLSSSTTWATSTYIAQNTSGW